MIIKTAIIFTLTCFNLVVLAQQGGKTVFNELSMVTSPRVASLGANFAAYNDNDININRTLPSFIHSSNHGDISLSFIDYFAGVNYGEITYGHHIEKAGSFIGAMQFINYGQFNRVDFTGNLLGEFNAATYIFQGAWGKPLSPHFSIGSSLKLAFTQLDHYTASALAFDLAGSYTGTDSSFTGVLLFQNVGRQIKAFIPGQTSPLPFAIHAGIIKKLKHNPLALSILITDLQKLDLTYNDPLHPTIKINSLTGDTTFTAKSALISDKIFRHIVFGGELRIAKALQLRLSYNYKQRKEMLIDTRKGMVGFSWGIGIKVKGFRFDYARSAYHLAGSPNFISITTNLQQLIK